jgi:hypothetical protein
MRSLLLAVLSLSCACASDESHRAATATTAVPPASPAMASAWASAAPATATAPANASPPAAAAEARDACPAPAPAAAPAPEAPKVAAVDPREATRRAAHDVLAEHCGECHEGHRPTAKPKALAIFDLDQPDWPSRFDDHKYKSALGRLSGKGDAARDAFIAFRNAELAAAKPN